MTIRWKRPVWCDMHSFHCNHGQSWHCRSNHHWFWLVGFFCTWLTSAIIITSVILAFVILSFGRWLETRGKSSVEIREMFAKAVRSDILISNHGVRSDDLISNIVSWGQVWYPYITILKVTMRRHSAILPGVSDVNYEGSVTEEKTGERNIS